jgi:hypothetical protein
LNEKQVESFFSVRLVREGYQLPETYNISIEDYVMFLRQEKLERLNIKI